MVLVQEYAEGGDLYRLLHKNGGRLHERQMVEMVLHPFLLALQYLHTKGIMHRDIKAGASGRAAAHNAVHGVCADILVVLRLLFFTAAVVAPARASAAASVAVIAAAVGGGGVYIMTEYLLYDILSQSHTAASPY